MAGGFASSRISPLLYARSPRPVHSPRFRNDATILALFVLLAELKPGCRVHLNLPEVYVTGFISDGLAVLGRHVDLWFSFNIMLQNIDLVPDAPSTARLARLGPVTITRAHKAYANARTEKLLRAPVCLGRWWSARRNTSVRLTD